jgi:hypothetical protein
MKKPEDVSIERIKDKELAVTYQKRVRRLLDAKPVSHNQERREQDQDVSGQGLEEAAPRVCLPSKMTRFKIRIANSSGRTPPGDGSHQIVTLRRPPPKEVGVVGRSNPHPLPIASMIPVTGRRPSCTDIGLKDRHDRADPASDRQTGSIRRREGRR